jgi:hypothetical protein
MKLKKIEVVLLTDGEGFELKIQGKRFSKELERQKTKSAFTWDTQEKHDPYQTHSFGENISAVIKPTSREDGLTGKIIEQ